MGNLLHSPVGSNVLQLLSQNNVQCSLGDSDETQSPWCLPSTSSYSSVVLTTGDETVSGISGNPWGLPREFITATTETNVLNKPVPVRKGRVSVPVRLLGVWVIVSPVSKSVSFTVEWSADTFGVVWPAAVWPVKLVELAAVLLDAAGCWGWDKAEVPVQSLPVLQVQLSFQPYSHISLGHHTNPTVSSHSQNHISSRRYVLQSNPSNLCHDNQWRH